MAEATPSTRPLAPALLLAAIYLLACIPVILIPRFDEAGRGGYDQINYHQRVIQTFADQLPTPDLSDYLSATTPGYHLALSLPRAAGASIRALRLIALAFPVALIIVVAGFVATRAPPTTAILATLPLAASMYIMHAGMWLLPDNAAWLGVALALAIAFRPRLDLAFYVGAALVLTFLVLMRQIHLWAAAPIWAAAWLGTRPDPTLRDAITPARLRLTRALAALAATLPAFITVAIFALIWDGLTPPRFQSRYGHPNPATPAFILSLLAIYSCFFGAWVLPAFLDLARRRRPILLLAAALGAVIAILPETSYDQAAGRWSGLWNIADQLPTVAHRSPLIIALAIAGAIALASWLHALPMRPRLIAAAALAAFTAAQTTSPELWQRYNEPFLLILLPLLVAQSRAFDIPPLIARLLPVARLAPIALALFFGALTAKTILDARPIRLIPLDEIQDVIDRVPRSTNEAP